jgi:hypothetical protein
VFLADVERCGEEDARSCTAIEKATGPAHTAFLLEQLPRARSEAARRAMLKALNALAVQDSAQAALPVLQVFLTAREEATARLCEQILTAAGKHLLPVELAAVAQAIGTAAANPERRARAARASELFPAAAAAPR